MQDYDYIIVGGGSAGCVLASRLTEDPDTRVLLLEAGRRDTHPFIAMPLAFSRMSRKEAYIRWYETEPEPGLNNRRLHIRRGWTLGGSSTINGMIALRGHPLDYDLWVQKGALGWGYNDVLPYFRKLESSWRGETEFHGADGPIRISQNTRPNLMFDLLAQSARAAGHRIGDDPAARDYTGISRVELSAGGGTRQSTARTYLAQARGRKGLTIETGAATTRLLLERGRCIGVEYRQDGVLKTAHAGAEVLLSGGSYHSPQLLMLSGIGRPDDLRAAGVEPLHELMGVGQNLHEHPIVFTGFETRLTDTLMQDLRLDRATAQVLRWGLTRGGPFATNGAPANLFFHTPGMASARPDIQVICSAVALDSKLWFPGITARPVHRFALAPNLLHPQSTGHLRLRSADPADTPRILFDFYRERSDLVAMVEAVKMVREIMMSGPMGRVLQAEARPGPEIRTDAEIEDWVRNTTDVNQHPLGTCRMGTDALSVVDPALRVHGIEGPRGPSVPRPWAAPSRSLPRWPAVWPRRDRGCVRGRSCSPAPWPRRCFCRRGHIASGWNSPASEA